MRRKGTGQVYAMKVMRKERILARDHGDYVRAEREVLTAVFHPYIVTLRCSFQVSSRSSRLSYRQMQNVLYIVIFVSCCNHLLFSKHVCHRCVEADVQLLCICMQTASKLYLVLDFVNGGHLFFQLYRQGIFDEDLARLYTAEMVLAIAHLHTLGIAHRDLKPVSHSSVGP